MSGRTYTFGREIVQFRLDIYRPQGDDHHFLDPNEVWSQTSLPFDPETLKPFLEEDEIGDQFFETIFQSIENPPNPLVGAGLKVLKPVWVVSFVHFGGGGIDYEISEGFFEDNWREDLLVTAAKEFKKRLEQAQKQASDPECWTPICPKTMPVAKDWDQFYAVINTYGTGRSDYWEDDFEFHIEFEGILDENAVTLT